MSRVIGGCSFFPRSASASESAGGGGGTGVAGGAESVRAARAVAPAAPSARAGAGVLPEAEVVTGNFGASMQWQNKQAIKKSLTLSH